LKHVSSVSIIALALAACSHDNNPTPIPTPLGNGWSIRYSPSMPSQARDNGNGTFSFDFPVGGACPQPMPPFVPFNGDGSPCHHVDYVTRTPIQLSNSVTLTYTVTGNPVFGSDTNTNEVSNGGGSPPHVTFIIDASTSGGDPGLTQGWLRWYAVPAGGSLTPGTHTVTMPLTFANWGDAGGATPGTAAQFNAVLASFDSIGFCLGGGAYAQCHGLYLKSGSATFTINSFTSP
jgi:hypothetical protein